MWKPTLDESPRKKMSARLGRAWREDMKIALQLFIEIYPVLSLDFTVGDFYGIMKQMCFGMPSIRFFWRALHEYALEPDSLIVTLYSNDGDWHYCVRT